MAIASFVGAAMALPALVLVEIGQVRPVLVVMSRIQLLTLIEGTGKIDW